MKVASIAISNIRSFEHDPSFQNAIEFDTNGLNLIIGPNASGKSNLVEIMMRIFTNIYDVTGSSMSNYDSDMSSLIRTTPSPTQLSSRAYVPGTFTRHRSYPNESMAIKLKITIDKKDKENLKFIKEKSPLLKRLYSYYFKELDGSGIVRIFDTEYTVPRLGATYEITLREQKEQHASYLVEDDSNALVVRYLKDYSLVCTLIDMYNELLMPERFAKVEKSNHLNLNYRNTVDILGLSNAAKPLRRLAPPLILMSVQERLSDIDLSFTAHTGENDNQTSSSKYRQIERNLGQKSTQGVFNGGQSDTFESIKSIIWRDVTSELETGRGSKETIKHINEHNSILQHFNSFVGHFRLKLSLASISISQGRLEFNLTESTNNVNMLDISSGQRAIINIASSLTIGNELRALVLIDEIENHLHPTVQSRLRDAMIQSAHDGSQALAVTHSPVFVNVTTLKSTIRMYMDGGHTVSRKCDVALTRENKAIFEILDYTNGSRVFFSEKVILVEGPSDLELYTAYLRQVMKNEEIEVLRVGGDGGLKKWWKIIEGFGVKVASIGDMDNMLSKARKSEIRAGRTGEAKNHSILWSELEANEYAEVVNNIRANRNTGRYVLEKGALEAYIPGAGGKTDRARDFITEGDWSKLKHKKELRGIFRAIIES